MPLDWPLVIARWVQFGSVMILFGSSLLRLASPSMPSGWVRHWPALVIVIIVSGLGWLAFQIASVGGDLSSLVDPAILQVFFLSTPFGHAWLFRLLVMAALAALCGRRQHALAAGPASFALLGAASLLVSQAWLGHTAISIESRNWPVVLAYFLHVLGAGAWVGGLPVLLWNSTHKSMSRMRAAAVLERFSKIAIPAMAVTVLGGIVSAASRLTTLQSLYTTDYGRLIVAKSALLTVALCLAARNLLVETPLLQIAEEANAAERRLRRNIGLEILLATAILFAASVLGISAPMK